MKKVLVIIPAYNEEKSIEKTVDSVIKASKNSKYEMDYVVINDGSNDSTAKLLKSKSFNFVDLPCNLGIGGAVQTGYLYAAKNEYDYSVQIDGDGQHNPIYIEKMIDTLENENTDMVIGSRFITCEGFQSTGMRQLGIKIIGTLIKMLTGKRITDATSGFRASNKNLTKFFSMHYADDYPEPEAIVSAVRNGFIVNEVPVIMNERENGKSSIFGMKSVYYMLKVSLALIILRMRRKEKRYDA